MHGIGNDYIFINCFEEHVKEPEKLAVKLSSRHYGIGGDGLILIKPPSGKAYRVSDEIKKADKERSDKEKADKEESDKKKTDRENIDGGYKAVREVYADAKMEIYNADGSKAQMCGNGIRCVAWFVSNYKKLDRDTVYIETDDGCVKTIYLKRNGMDIESITVNMGKPYLRPDEIPAVFPKKDMIVNEKITVNNTDYTITCVNMGNPHCVLFFDKIEEIALMPEIAGPVLEHAAKYFPERVNVEFVHCITKNYCKMRVWERGSQITLACGTGACAAVVAGVLNGFLEREVTVELDGGILKISWDRESGEVYMTGDAQKVFIGEV